TPRRDRRRAETSLRASNRDSSQPDDLHAARHECDRRTQATSPRPTCHKRDRSPSPHQPRTENEAAEKRHRAQYAQHHHRVDELTRRQALPPVPTPEPPLQRDHCAVANRCAFLIANSYTERAIRDDAIADTHSAKSEGIA